VDEEQLEQLHIEIMKYHQDLPCKCGGSWHVEFEVLAEGGGSPPALRCPSGRDYLPLVMLSTSGWWSVKHYDPKTGETIMVDGSENYRS